MIYSLHPVQNALIPAHGILCPVELNVQETVSPWPEPVFNIPRKLNLTFWDDRDSEEN